MDESLVLELAASLEVHSEHPIAKGVVRGAQERRIALKSTSDFKAIPGKGVIATINDIEYIDLRYTNGMAIGWKKKLGNIKSASGDMSHV